jgi:hypothetical protein
MAHTCPECGQYCTCNGDWDDIDFGEDLDCRHCPEETIDILVTVADIDRILPLGKRGCKECDGLTYYCDECTRKIYAAQQWRAVDAPQAGA